MGKNKNTLIGNFNNNEIIFNIENNEYHIKINNNDKTFSIFSSIINSFKYLIENKKKTTIIIKTNVYKNLFEYIKNEFKDVCFITNK